MEPTSFGTWLSMRIAAEGWNQNQFARRAGVETGTVSKWATGKNRPDLDSCELIADALGVDVVHVMRRAGYLRSLPAEEPEEVSRLIARLRRLRLEDPRYVEDIEEAIARVQRWERRDARLAEGQRVDPAVDEVPDAQAVQADGQQQQADGAQEGDELGR